MGPTFRRNILPPSSILKIHNFELVDEWVNDCKNGREEVVVYFIKEFA
jgi:hypothetical protein